MYQLNFLVTTNELTDNEKKKINLYGKLYWFSYLSLSLLVFACSYIFLSLSQYFQIGFGWFCIFIFIFTTQFIFDDHKREISIELFSEPDFSILQKIFVLLFVLVIGLFSILIWPLGFIGLLIKPFGFINIINKKLENNSQFILKLNGSEIYKLNNQFHREIEEFQNKYYYLPSIIKRSFPSFKAANKYNFEYFESSLKSRIDNIWYLFGEKQKKPHTIKIHKEELEKFKENINKQRIKSINQNF